MPHVITVEDGQVGSLAECDEALSANLFHPEDEESLHHAALQLRRLGNNQTFLGVVLIDELKRKQRDDTGENSYGPQVIMLRRSGKGNFLSAPISGPVKTNTSCAPAAAAPSSIRSRTTTISTF